MRTLVPLVLAGLLLAAPAQAQLASQYHVALSVVPPQDAFTLRDTLATAEGKVDLTGDATMLLEREAVPVRYAVTDAPAWLSVTLTPAEDAIPLSFTGSSVVGSRTFTVSMTARNVGEGATGTVEITATVLPQGLGASPQVVVQTFSVTFYVAPEDRLVFHERAAAPPEPSARQEPALQGVPPAAEAREALLWPVLGAFALAGAGAGLFLRRSLKA